MCGEFWFLSRRLDKIFAEKRIFSFFLQRKRALFHSLSRREQNRDTERDIYIFPEREENIYTLRLCVRVWTFRKDRVARLSRRFFYVAAFCISDFSREKHRERLITN